MLNRRKWGAEPEDSLRAHRAEASPDFVDGLSARVRGERFAPRRGWSRAAFAAGVSVFILGTFASLGGLSYAASGATQAYDVVQHAVVTQKLKVSVHSSAAAQYPHPPSKVAGAKVHKTKPHYAVKAAVVVQSGTLPFTGFSLLATFLVSLSLIGGGIALRRRERRSS
jgi:hypothetical protein